MVFFSTEFSLVLAMAPKEKPKEKPEDATPKKTRKRKHPYVEDEEGPPTLVVPPYAAPLEELTEWCDRHAVKEVHRTLNKADRALYKGVCSRKRNLKHYLSKKGDPEFLKQRQECQKVITRT